MLHLMQETHPALHSNIGGRVYVQYANAMAGTMGLCKAFSMAFMHGAVSIQKMLAAYHAPDEVTSQKSMREKMELGKIPE